jgi:hypothetical protein
LLLEDGDSTERSMALPPAPVPPLFSGIIDNLRCFVSYSWYEVCGKIDEGHLLAGTRVEEVRNWRSATSYVERYMAKEETFPEGLQTGRIWGMWNEGLLPVLRKAVEVSLSDAYRIRRVYRRLAELRGKGDLHRLTVFVRHENVVRLPGFLAGYTTRRTRKKRVPRDPIEALESASMNR